MKLALIGLALAGLGLAAGLIVYQGAGAIGQAMLNVGWGIVLLAAYHLLPLACSALGWRTELRRQWWAPFWVFMWARWVREHVALLLPAAQVGGEVVGARLLTFRGLSAGAAGASVIVDITVEALSQLVFTLVGLALLIELGGGLSIAPWVGLGVVLGIALIAGFIWAQQHGLFRWLVLVLRHFGKRSKWFSLGRIGNLNSTIQAMYADVGGLTIGAVYHFVCWMLGMGEVWLALWLMGRPVSWDEALMLESLTEAIRSAAFAIPGQFGVQEGGYLLLGGFIGLPADISLALSLLKRVRIIVLGVPALLAWQWAEGRRLWHRRKR
jgi:putative membrane protein